MSQNDRAGNVPAPLILYARVSTLHQAEEGVSLSEQRERMSLYCGAKGYEVLRYEEDAGVSGSVSHRERPGLSRALSDVRSGKAGGIVVSKLDRLSRSVRDILDLTEEAAKRGWCLVSVAESLDTSSAMGRFVVTIFAGLAQMEREVIGERTRAGMEQLCREGKRRSGRPPFGYAVDGKRLVRCEEEQRCLGAMLEARMRFKVPAIASYMNSQGWFNPRTGSRWTASNVWAILKTHDRRARLVG
jgi:site-specific DNA recombinase